MQPRIEELLRHVFERKGYAVDVGRPLVGTSGKTYRAPLFAGHSSGDLLVIWNAETPVTGDDLTAVASAVADTHVAGAVVASLEPTTAAAPPGSRVELWTLPRVVAEVGEALIHLARKVEPKDVGGTPVPSTTANNDHKFKSLVALASDATGAADDPNVYLYKSAPRPRVQTPDDAKPLPYAWSGAGAARGAPTHEGVAQVRRGRRAEARPVQSTIVVPDDADVELTETPRRAEPEAPAAPSEATASGLQALAANADVAMEDDVELVTTPRAPPAPPAVPAAPAPAEEEFELLPSRSTTPTPAAAEPGAGAPPQTVSVRYSRDAALRAAAGRVGTVQSVRLKLVPHLAFDYDARVTSPHLEAPLAGKGAVYVDAITGTVRDGDSVAFAKALPEAVDPPAAAELQAADVFGRVKAHLVKRYSRSLKVEREVSGNVVSEQVRVVATPQDLGLNPRGVVNVPVWSIQGDAGEVDVDGFTGAVR